MQKLAYYDRRGRPVRAAAADAGSRVSPVPAWSGSVLVPVPLVGRVPVTVVEVVRVPVVGHGHVAALRPVLVGVALVGGVPTRLALVHVIAVDSVDVAVVGVVGVIAVRERDMAAGVAVGVLMAGVGRVNGIGHGGGPLCAVRRI
jgi:hypothetical protein